MSAGHASVPLPRSISLMRRRSHVALRAARDTLVVEKTDCRRSGVPRGAEKRCAKRTCARERGRGHKARRSLGAITARPPSRHAVDRGDGAPLSRARLFEERVPPPAVVYNRLNHGCTHQLIARARSRSSIMPERSARLPGRDRRQVCVAVDGLLPHVLATIEQEYGESDSDQCAEDGAQFAVPCPVVSHHRLRSSGLMQPTPAANRGSCAATRPIWNCGSLVAAPSSVYQK